MKHSYKVILYLAILANMRCTCETRKIGQKSANPLKQEQKANHSTEISDEKNNKSKNPIATTAHSYEAIWQQWLNKDNQIAHIKTAINSIIKSMGLLEEEQTKMYNEFYATRLNSDDKVKPLIDELLAYRQQLKYLCDQWPDSKKKDFCDLISKQENPKILKSLLLLATDDEKKIQQLHGDHIKKKNELVINFIKNSEIVEKMPKQFQEAVLKVIKDNDKKALEKTLAERFEAIFDKLNHKKQVIKRIKEFLQSTQLSEYEQKAVSTSCEERLNHEPVDETMKPLIELLDTYIEQIKKYCLELPAKQGGDLADEHEKNQGNIVNQFFEFAPNDAKKNLANIAIQHRQKCQPLVIDCVQKIVETMSYTFQKPIEEGIEEYKKLIKEKIDRLRKY
ncbi:MULTISPECIES: hypothetical protein [unclassified Candidatus Cardinium]|uniref:hypothetical protein n=1 Tax=unclassified Candidatus Cardinium TaxID=2641185 RepID=UPI001FB34F29|nr:MULTISPECIES: hypothetical protein [unclassified Candidatus Cardinium]